MHNKYQPSCPWTLHYLSPNFRWLLHQSIYPQSWLWLLITTQYNQCCQLRSWKDNRLWSVSLWTSKGLALNQKQTTEQRGTFWEQSSPKCRLDCHLCWVLWFTPVKESTDTFTGGTARKAGLHAALLPSTTFSTAMWIHKKRLFSF